MRKKNTKLVGAPGVSLQPVVSLPRPYYQDASVTLYNADSGVIACWSMVNRGSSLSVTIGCSEDSEPL